MSALVVLMLLALLAVVAVTVVAAWRGVLPLGLDQAVERARIEAAEQMAVWQLQAIRRQAQAEMRRVRDAHRSRSPLDRDFPSP